MKSIRNLAIVLFALLALPLAAQIPTDPVAWLKAEGNALDATSNANHGVVNGSVPYVTGKVGSAFSFTGNGANSVRIPNSASLQSSLLSVEYWIFFNNAQNSVNVTKRSSTGAGDAWQVGISYSGGNFNLQFVGNTAGGLFDWYSPPLSSPVGVWTHVAATYDGSTVKGYINGTQVLTLAVALQLGSRNADIFVGAYPTGVFALDGKIDELSIFNRALSASEILAIYQAGSAGKTAPAPTVTGVSPSSGSTLGGTSVTITGTNFTGATAVTFGGNPATGVTVVNSTTITAITPARAAGAASVVVTTPGGSNAANSLYTYATPAPTVTSVSPSSGSTLGGTSVTITGTNFTGATAVTFGGNVATGVTVVNSTTITATTPARAAGATSVIVTTPGGSNAANSLFTYVTPAPAVTSISPSSGSTSGGTSVTITGTNFTGATAVTFGGNPAIGVTVVNSTTITAITPARAAGATSVVVTTSGGSNAANSLYTYVTPSPTVTASSVNLLSTSTTLTINGTGFDSVTPGNNTVVFTPSGTGTVTAATSTSLTVTGLSGLSLGALSAVVTTNTLSSGAPVQVATVVVPGPGDLDPLNPTIAGSYLTAIAVQPDGKTILVGYFNTVSGVPRGNIARLNVDGTLDTGFDPKTDGTVNGVVVQPDGKIVIGGSFSSLQPNGAASATPRVGIARLNQDGTLDNSVDYGMSGGVDGVALQADGKILLVGSFTYLFRDSVSTPRGRVARLNADGTLDTGFNPNANAGVATVVEQADGKILLGGSFTSLQPNGAASPTPRVGIARVNADGTLDTGFDPRINDFGYVTCMLEQPDGKILFGGNFGTVQPNGAAGATPRSRIARVNADGTLDTAFSPAVSGGSVVYGLALQADGKILVGGDYTGIQENGAGPFIPRGSIARLNADGTIDMGFDPMADNWVPAVALQKDGKVLLGGGFSTLQPNGAASPTPRSKFARLINGSATDNLTAVDATEVLWTRGGSAPEFSRVIFEVSVNGGSTWVPIGQGTRVGTSSNWNLTGLSLPASGQLRARGAAASSLIETIVSFSGLVAPAPTVTGISPASGTTFGGTGVTINGTGFTGATAVTFGGTAAASFSVVNSTTITATTPAHAAGAVSVEVTTASGSNGANTYFTYIAPPAPTVVSVSPSSGLTTGGTSVTLTGTDFLGATAVTFGGNPATNVTVIDSTTITATTPARAAGTVSVVVTTPSGSNAANTLYTYVAPAPTLTSVSPADGSTAGGTSVTLTGTDFIGATAVTFGGNPAGYSVVNATTITATTPAHAAGAVTVIVTTPSGSNAANTLFTYVAPPTVTASTAAVLSTSPTLTISGTGFSTTPANNSVVFTPSGTGTVTGSTSTSLTVTGVSGITPGALSAVVTTNSLSSGAPVQVATVVDPGTGDLDPLNPSITGSGVYTTVVQPDGKIIVAGQFSSVNGVARGNIARLNADGTLDSGFNPNANDSVFSIAVQPDGKILLGGSFSSLQPNGAGSPTARQSIARLNADGSLDTGFDPKANAFSYVSAIAVQTDGKIVFGGSFISLQPNGAPSATTRSRIARVNADGTLDTGFSPIANNDVSCIAVQEDGRILIGGNFTTLTDGVTGGGFQRIARLSASGVPDLSFFPQANARVSSIAVQPDGKILLGGLFTTLQPNGSPSATTRNRIARVHADGTLDTSFDTNANNLVTSVSLQTDGKILFSGTFTTLQPNGAASASTRQRIARLLTDGSLDSTFAPQADGFAVFSVAQQADGRVLIGGDFTSIQNGVIGATPRGFFALLVNDSATQSLGVTGGSDLLWTRGGSSPEVTRVAFDVSTNGGSTWSPLGLGSRVGTTSNWQLTGLSLPPAGQVRARGANSGGYFSGSSGLIESVTSYLPDPPAIASVTPSTGSTLGGTNVTITGVRFTTTTAVAFAGNAAASFSVVDDTTITATTPPGTAGPASVVVTTLGGGNGANSLFTYVEPNTPPRFDLAFPPENPWTARGSNGTWNAITSSADGRKLAAVEGGGKIHTSDDNGVTWTARESDRGWQSITSSADGTRLAATVDDGQIFTSVDSGETWTPRESQRYWKGIASSADGMKLAAVADQGQIYTSPDGGVTWTARESTRSWSSIASSADGTKLAAATFDGHVYTSTDSGETWSPRETARGWTCITSSADGTKLAAGASNGQIHVSTDSGVTWTARATNRLWYSIASSADGNRLAAVGPIFVANPYSETLGPIFISEDGGVTWTTQESERDWRGVACSADGGKLAAVDVYSRIFINRSYNLTVMGGSGPFTSEDFATNISPGPAWESGQTVSFLVTNDNNSLFTIQPAISSDGTLTFTPGLTAGVATVTVVAQDDGGTVYGGSGTSPAQTFTITLLTPPPAVSAIIPGSGGTLGGANITITGTSFTGATSVTIGGTAAANVTVVDSTTITATTPAGVAGPASVVVTTPEGSNSANSLFTYLDVNTAPSFSLPASAAQPRASDRYWIAIASSADGTKLAAAELPGQIYTSADGGETWNARATEEVWVSIASSADGTKLAAGIANGRIYISTDSGVSWTATASAGNWQSITSSADGSKLAAVDYGKQIHTSTDGGVTWTARESFRDWRSITSSADGSKLAAVVAGGQIYTSTDSGETWTARMTDANRSWVSISSSADGVNLVAAEYGGWIHTSTNGGATWTARESDRNWWTTASSADGSKLAAAEGLGRIFTSTNGGVSWTPNENSRNWSGVALSADGNKLAAAASGGRIHTSPFIHVAVEPDSGPSTMVGFLTDISPGPAVDAGQTVTFQVINDNNALFVVQPSISSNGTLTFTPGSTVGVATVTVIAHDNGGTALGGSDTSAPQTFVISVQEMRTPSESWRQTYFGTTANTGDAADDFDFDGDGLVNLLEYGLVLSPTERSAAPAAEIVAYAEGDRLRMILQRDPERSDVTIEVQASADPTGTWTTIATSTLGSPFTGPGYVDGEGAGAGVKTVEIRDTVNLADAPHRFLRVKVTR